MSDRLPERTIMDMVGDALDLLQRAPLFFIGPLFAFELLWAITMDVFSHLGLTIATRLDGDVANLPSIYQALIILFVSFFAALVVLVILYSFLLAIAQLAAREALERRTITLSTALDHARKDLFPTMSSLGWFALFPIPALLVLGGAVAVTVQGQYFVGFLLALFPIAFLFLCGPLFRLAFGVNAMTPLRGRPALAAGWAVAKERLPEVFALALLLVVASVIGSVLGSMLNAPLPSSFDLSSLDIGSLSKLDVRSIVKTFLKPDDKPLWAVLYAPIATAVAASVKEAFAYALLCVWFARRSVPTTAI